MSREPCPRHSGTLAPDAGRLTIQHVRKGTCNLADYVYPFREIDRLRARVGELEVEVEACRGSRRSCLGTVPTPSESAGAGDITPMSNKESNPSFDTADSVSCPYLPKPTGARWEGIFTATARSEQTSYYGPASAFYFISRIGAYLGKTLQQPLHDQHMQLHGISRTLTNPGDETRSEEGLERAKPARASDVVFGAASFPSMPRTREEYFLGLYWESYHGCYPVLDEGEFRRHYNSLWDDVSRPTRKHSALVDIVLALSMQYGYTLIPREQTNLNPPKGQSPDRDATVAGRWYYRRCQSLLAIDLESPSLTTLQCYILSIVYLCCASFNNTAHIFIAQAIRMAHLLGFHLEPPSSMPRAERELQKRVWWVLCATETKTCTKLGRPFLADASRSTVSLPSDGPEAASLNGATLVSSYDGVTWLTYSVQCQKLLAITTGVYNAAWSRYNEILEAMGQTGSPYRSPEALEACAEFLSTQIPALQTWVDQVPAAMKTPRAKNGRPFSVDRTPLEIDRDVQAPTWLRRERLHLEMLYHVTVLNLYRPFISFHPGACGDTGTGPYTPTAERHAAACANHAIAHILLAHQAVTQTDLMAGWQEFFLWHWNATVTLVGFLLAYPVHVSTAHARAAMEKSIEVCDIFAENFAVAASAASIARDLTARADILMGHIRNDAFSPAALPPSQPDRAAAAASEQASATAAGWDGAAALGSAGAQMEGGLEWLEPGRLEEDHGYFSEFMDWALTVESFNSFERFYEQSDPAQPALFG